MITNYTNIYNEFDEPLNNAHLVSINGGEVTNTNGFAQVTGNPEDLVRISFVGTQTIGYKLKDLPKRIVMKMESLPEVVISNKPKSDLSGYVVPGIIATLGLLALMSFGKDAPGSNPKKVIV